MELSAPVSLSPGKGVCETQSGLSKMHTLNRGSGQRRTHLCCGAGRMWTGASGSCLLVCGGKGKEDIMWLSLYSCTLDSDTSWRCLTVQLSGQQCPSVYTRASWISITRTVGREGGKKKAHHSFPLYSQTNLACQTASPSLWQNIHPAPTPHPGPSSLKEEGLVWAHGCSGSAHRWLVLLLLGLRWSRSSQRQHVWSSKDLTSQQWGRQEREEKEGSRGEARDKTYPSFKSHLIIVIQLWIP